MLNEDGTLREELFVDRYGRNVANADGIFGYSFGQDGARSALTAPR